MVAPPALAESVLAARERKASVINVIHLAGAARSPSGDVILCDIAREDASVVLAELRDLGLAEQGTIAVETVDTSISTAARAAERAAAGLVRLLAYREPTRLSTTGSSEPLEVAALRLMRTEPFKRKSFPRRHTLGTAKVRLTPSAQPSRPRTTTRA